MQRGSVSGSVSSRVMEWCLAGQSVGAGLVWFTEFVIVALACAEMCADACDCVRWGLEWLQKKEKNKREDFSKNKTRETNETE